MNLLSSTFLSALRCILYTAGWVEGTKCQYTPFPISAEFWRHCVLSGGIQHRALPRHQGRNENIHFILLSRVAIKLTNSRSSIGPPAPRLASPTFNYY